MMVIVDTGPLVAALNQGDTYHEWAIRQLQQIPSPLLTCEAVLTEVSFLIRHRPDKVKALFTWLKNDVLNLPLQIALEHHYLEILMHKYANMPMSLADACLVRLAELHPDNIVMTLDSDFRIYRVFRDQPLKLIMPSTIK